MYIFFSRVGDFIYLENNYLTLIQKETSPIFFHRMSYIFKSYIKSKILFISSGWEPPPPPAPFCSSGIIAWASLQLYSLE